MGCRPRCPGVLHVRCALVDGLELRQCAGLEVLGLSVQRVPWHGSVTKVVAMWEVLGLYALRTPYRITEAEVNVKWVFWDSPHR